MSRNYVVMAAVLILSSPAFPQVASPDAKDVFFMAAQNGSSAGKDQTFTYVEKLPSSYDPVKPEDMRFFTVMAESSKMVKNAPYTATATTETTQTLGDGNRIVNTTTASLARDSEGRTRREENLVKIGNLQGEGSRIVIINDPVAHTEFVFQPGDATGSATGQAARFGIGAGAGAGAGSERHKVRTFTLSNGETSGKVMMGAANERGTKTWLSVEDRAEDTNVKHESLGTQTIEGVTAEGIRDTKTIPAGAIGNEKPIVITSEIWTSPELQIVVLSKRNDPRVGETVYKLNGINRSEPDPGLFQAPVNLKKEVQGPAKY